MTVIKSKDMSSGVTLLLARTCQAIYACHGREAPQTSFPDRIGGSGTKNTNGKASGTDEPRSRGGGDGQIKLPSPTLQNGAVTEGDTSSSQVARDLCYHRGDAGRRGVPATGSAVVAGGTRGPDGVVLDAVANNVDGTPPRELELNNGVFWPDSTSASTGRGVADGSVLSSAGGEGPEKSAFPSRVATAVGTGSSTTGSSSLPSIATSVLMGSAPKLLDFFDMQDEASSRQFRAARDYLEGFRELNLDRAILESGLGATGQRMAALDLPLMARYTFQVID